MISKLPIIETNSNDDFLYLDLLSLFSGLRLIMGGSELNATLKRHSKIRDYMLSKAYSKLIHLETEFFNDDGTLIIK